MSSARGNQIQVKAAAEADIEEAWAWYARTAPELGEAWLQALDLAFAQIQRNPYAWQVVYKDAHRALVRKFPYAIIYRIRPERVVVLAVAHASRDPRRWKSRL